MFKKISCCLITILLLCSVMVGAANKEEIPTNKTDTDLSQNVLNYEESSDGIELFASVKEKVYCKQTIRIIGQYDGSCNYNVRVYPSETTDWYDDFNDSNCYNGNATFTSDYYIYVSMSNGGWGIRYAVYGNWNGTYGYRYFAGYHECCYVQSTQHTYQYSKSAHPHYKYCDCGSVSNTTSYKSSCYDCNPGTLKYYANGGTGAPSNKTVYESYPTISSTKPTRFGYKFLGWSTSSTATSASYIPGDDIYVGTGSTKKLYAVWEEAKLLETHTSAATFKIDLGFATGTTNIKVKGTMGYFKFIPVESTTYVFESTNSSGNPCAYLYDSSGNQLAYNNDSGIGTNTSNFRISYNLTADTTYYYGVKWSSSSTTGSIDVSLRRQYNIKFDANGGTSAPDAQTKLYGDTLTLSTVEPIRSGYTFLGWASENNSVDAEYLSGGEYKANDDKTLYAVWKAEGVCGDSCNWVLDNAGTLTISGTGEMANYASASITPWNSMKNDIKKVVVSEGITKVGDNCFNSSSEIAEVSLPSTLVEIGIASFKNCASLSDITMLEGVTKINHHGFAECTALKNVTIPLSLSEINDYAFYEAGVETVKYKGSPTRWNKIAKGEGNEILSYATKVYEVEDFTVTYAVTANGACSADKTSEVISCGDMADLTVVAQRATLPGDEPIGSEKNVPWEFLGWNTDQNATSALDEVIVTSDITLYPIFKKELTYNFYHGNNELLESKTVTIYNNETTAKLTMPSIEAYLDWEPVEWCNDIYYSDMSTDAKMFDMGEYVNLQYSSDFYARYKRTATVSYDVGDYSEIFEPNTFIQYYYGSGQKTSETVLMPEVLSSPVGEPIFYGWAKGSADGDVFQSGEEVTVEEDVVMYALWQERAAVPTISVSDNNGIKQVSMLCPMDGAAIYYTTDGTEPSAESNLYAEPITITKNEDMIFKAVAVKDGYAYSKPVEKNVILNTASTPISSVLPGYVKNNSIVSLSTDIPGAVIYYTIDGTIPTRDSDIYSTPFTITDSIGICAVAVKDGMKDSPVTMFKYTVIDDSAPYINILTTKNDDNTLTATVNITENSKAAGGSFNLIYDRTVLEIVEVNKGSYIKYANPYIKKDYRENSIRVVWAGVEELEGGGEILTAKFKLLSTTKEQTLLSIEKAKLSDSDANKLTVQSSDTIVLLSSNTQYFDEYKTETTVGNDKKSLVVNLIERADKDGCLIIAVYSSDGKLIQCKPTDIITGQDTYTIPLEFALENKPKIKVFVWTSLNTLKPISNNEEFICE